MCDVSRNFETGNETYRDALRGLNEVIHRKTDVTLIGPLMRFVAQLTPDFVNTLERIESKALLISLYWHTLLLMVGQWW